MSAADEISSMFHDESEKMAGLIDTASASSGLSIHEIIETYYQVMNVSSMISMLRQLDTEKQGSLLGDIGDAEKAISEKFNADIHPKILSQLTRSIQEMTKSLQSGPGTKSRGDIEGESESYEELRKLMSTKEFVEQYSQGLPHD